MAEGGGEKEGRGEWRRERRKRERRGVAEGEEKKSEGELGENV